MTDVRLLRMTGYLLKENYFDKAVLPLGSTEYHGDHLPFGTDTLVAESLAEAVSQRVAGMLCLPTLPFGMSRHYASFPLSITLSTETQIHVIKEVIDSLNQQGLRRLLIINGHDGNLPAIEAATREYRADHSEMKIAVLDAWWVTAAELLPKGTFEAWGGLGHAGEGETSIMLKVAPELVNLSRARGHIPNLPEHVQVKWLFKEITPFGVTGDPTKATSEKGILMWNALVDHLVSFIEDMDRDGWEVDQQK
ncbi:MAG: creatininase family protein [Candidatus Bathyarchaeia archaeon]